MYLKACYSGATIVALLLALSISIINTPVTSSSLLATTSSPLQNKIPTTTSSSSSSTTTTTPSTTTSTTTYNETHQKIDSSLNLNSSSSDIQKQQQQSNTTTLINKSNRQQITQAIESNFNNNCSSECSADEFSDILQHILQDDNIIKRFKEIEGETESKTTTTTNISLSLNYNIRPICIRELIKLIKGLASNELEMKTMLEFASDSGASFSHLQVSKNNSSSSSNQDASSSRPQQRAMSDDSAKPSSNFLQLTASPQSGYLNKPGCNSDLDRDATRSSQSSQASTNQYEAINGDSSEKSRILPKFVANVDHWINTLERFTLTREWTSLMKVFQGIETILDMFVSTTTTSIPKQSNEKSSSSMQTNINGTTNSSSLSSSKVQPLSVNTSSIVLIENLKDNLPSEVSRLTTSLSELFPWHVWPWNNVDLYGTIDTFLNHGIFAFSKTTVGPTRRIDFLPDMLQTLFKSLKFESFPKKCSEWSRIICDQSSYHDRLVIPPSLTEETSSATIKEREEKVKELIKVNKNQLTQELTCIMFSSLSMQNFGGNDNDSNLEKADAKQALLTQQMSTSTATNSLPWDKQVQKALKLYILAREALTDEQWKSIYNLINDLWSQQKISDRVIMVGRIVQLLTNCHMPKEMLESALWKDIYKYKNVLNQLLDIVIEELNRSSESGKLQISQLALGSKHLDEILFRFIKILPKLLESLSQTVVDQLPELVNKFFNEKAAFFKVPCKGYSFSDIIPSLSKYKKEIIEIEKLVCQQLHTKPNITMMQIDNLTNNFLAMAFNFSNFGTNLAFPKLLTNLDNANNEPLKKIINTSNINQIQSLINQEPSSTTSLDNNNSNNNNKNNVTSIIDEMAANPRLAQIVAILQSSALDPPEVHAELPELDWVEAGTSIALLYESIQKLLSYEEVFTIFPEIDGFQKDFKTRIDSIQSIFKKFVKRDPIRLVAYGLDAVMPIALRTFKPMDSFHAECITSFRDIFSEDIEGKATRQWQCVISSMNFGSWVLNNFMKTFNIMFRDILDQMTNESLIRSKYKAESEQQQSMNNTCIFFDGSVSMMLDNLPQFIDLALETVLMASTTSDQQLTLYDIMCSSNYMLDPFNEKSIELKARMKNKMCHLFHKKSLANCADVLKIDQWTQTMKLLNSTWFESNAVSLNPSFRDITLNVHEFLELFGQFKPSTMSDSLIARVLNVNSFWTNLLNRTMTIIDKYQEKRFEYALQTLTPIIYDNLPTSSSFDANNNNNNNNNNDNNNNNNDTTAVIEFNSDLKEVREILITTIVGAKTILNYLDKKPNNTTNNSQQMTNNTDFESRIQTLFNWADQYSMVTAEVLLKTIANNITKFESIFILNQSVHNNSNVISKSNLTYSGKTKSMQHVWNRFCSSPVDKYLDFQNEINTDSINNQTNNTTKNSSIIITNNDPIFIQMREGKEIICKFDWQDLYNQLGVDSNKILANFSEKQLTRIALTKWGQVLDVMFIESKIIKQLPKFFYMDHWQQFRHKLPQISPLKDQPSNLVWIWKGFERIVNAIDENSNQTSKQSLIRILDQLNCGLDAVKGGLSWENIASIYQDKQDILAAYSTINNGFTLASIGVNTFLAHKKFQRFLDEFVKPKVGLNAFCEMRDRLQLESIFSIPEGQDYLNALESFQELICDTNFETLAQNINPISVCYQITTTSPPSNQQQQQQLNSYIGGKNGGNNHPLADIMDRFFKLASLAILDAKLIVTSEAKPPILDKNQWITFWNWWSDKAEPQPKSSLALSIVRAFQTIDSINSNHVVWKALFRSVHEISEVIAYLLRAIEKKHQEVDMIGASSRLYLMKEAASQIDTAIRANNLANNNNNSSKQQNQQQQQLASTLSNIMFPEVNNFISFRTFKQLRYIKSISEYFTYTKGAQESICKSSNISNDKQQQVGMKQSRIELIGYKLNTNEKLYSLLCHYHSSQWLTALNIVISTRTTSIPKKVNYMTKYLSIFTRSYKHNESLDNFIHSQQLENIENVANTTVSYLVTTSHSLKSLSFSKISNVSWHSLPNLLDSIDRHLCASKYEHGSFHIPVYEPKKPDLETMICKLPSWNMSQVYEYLSENFDLQNMISLISQQSSIANTNQTATITTTKQQQHQQQQQVETSTITIKNTTNTTIKESHKLNQTRTCITPFKFASRWLKIGQETVDEFMTKSSRDKIKKCLSSFKKGHSIYPQSVRYIKLVNSLLTYINDLTINNSWNVVKKTWNSISYLIINQNPSYIPKLY